MSYPIVRERRGREPDGRMSPERFRAFQEERPDEERWELVDRVPTMMTPPSIAHNRIASNLERILNDALERHDPTREAVQRPGIDLALDASAPAGADGYRPEPDVAVIDHDPVPGRRFVARAYLLAEVLSPSDDAPTGDGARWIEMKTRLYRAHPACRVVLVLSQDRIAARLSHRTDEGWAETTLEGAHARLVLAEFGVDVALAAVYRGTFLVGR